MPYHSFTTKKLPPLIYSKRVHIYLVLRIYRETPLFKCLLDRKPYLSILTKRGSQSPSTSDFLKILPDISCCHMPYSSHSNFSMRTLAHTSRRNHFIKIYGVKAKKCSEPFLQLSLSTRCPDGPSWSFPFSLTIVLISVWLILNTLIAIDSRCTHYLQLLDW